MSDPKERLGVQGRSNKSVLKYISLQQGEVEISDIYTEFQSLPAYNISRTITHLFSWELVQRVNASTVVLSGKGWGVLEKLNEEENK